MGQRMFTLGFVLSNSCSHCQGNIPDNYIHLFRGFSAIPASPSVFLLGNLDDFTRSHFEGREMGKRGLRYPRLHKNMDWESVAKSCRVSWKRFQTWIQVWSLWFKLLLSCEQEEANIQRRALECSSRILYSYLWGLLKEIIFFTGYIVSSCMVAHFTTFLARNRERRNGSILIVLFIMGPGHEGLKN